MTNLYFQSASLVYMLMILILFFSKKRVTNFETKLFAIISVINLIGIMLDILIVYLSYVAPFTSSLYILNKFYLLYILDWSGLFTIYIANISLIDKQKLLSIVQSLITSVCIIATVLIFILPIELINNLVIMYTDGPSVLVLVFTCGIFIVTIAILVLGNIKNIISRKYIPVYALLVLSIVAFIVRSVSPVVLLTTFIITVINVLMYHTIENPDVKMLNEVTTAKIQAERSNRAKSDFLSSMSHEIRTPLNSILGFGQYLSEADLPQNERIEMFDHLQKSSTRLMNTVDDYVDIAMIVTSTMKVNKKEFIVQPFFDEFIADTFYLFNHLKIEYIVDTPIQSSNLALFSDKELIRKILLKLLDNAIKFTSRGSISCGYKVLDESIEFFVKDTGKGIAQEKIDMIFKMFSQEESSMTRGYEGSGLGLTISKGLLNLLGGEIQVSSVKGIGSNFSFRIPFKTIETQTNPDEDLKLFDNQNKPVILVAEDDELNYMYMETLFNRNGFEFFHVENGLEAVELCKENPQINIVFMDIKMPVMNGLEATKLIRGFRPDLPIIATTAYAQTGDEERFLSEGCNDYLAKPIRKEKLMEIIKKYAKC